MDTVAICYALPMRYVRTLPINSTHIPLKSFISTQRNILLWYQTSHCTKTYYGRAEEQYAV
jgi:hypothetical protein